MSDISSKSDRVAGVSQRSNEGTSEHSAFSVLFVCSGNICRSPMVEQISRSRIRALFHGDVSAADAAVRLVSAGTIASPGQQMPEQASQLSLHYGGDPSGHQAKVIDARMVGEADLVIAMAREHRSAVARMLPRANRYTFTLREFADLIENMADSVDGERVLACGPLLSGQLRELVPAIASRRGLSVPKANEEDYDVVDPYRRSQETYGRSGDQAVRAIDGIMSAALSITQRKRVSW